MAFINTDWTKELEQVEATLSKLLDEKVEPMIDQTLDRSVKEISVVMDKASFEIQDAIKLLSVEIDRQRRLVVNDCKRLIILSFGGMAILVVLFFVVANLFGVN